MKGEPLTALPSTWGVGGGGGGNADEDKGEKVVMVQGSQLWQGSHFFSSLGHDSSG